MECPPLPQTHTHTHCICSKLAPSLWNNEIYSSPLSRQKRCSSAEKLQLYLVLFVCTSGSPGWPSGLGYCSRAIDELYCSWAALKCRVFLLATWQMECSPSHKHAHTHTHTHTHTHCIWSKLAPSLWNNKIYSSLLCRQKRCFSVGNFAWFSLYAPRRRPWSSGLGYCSRAIDELYGPWARQKQSPSARNMVKWNTPPPSPPIPPHTNTNTNTQFAFE